MQSFRQKSQSILLNSLSSSSSQSQSHFHVTRVSFAKRKSKWDFVAGSSREKPDKAYVRYQTRLSRARSKQALRDFLSRCSMPKIHFQGSWNNAEGNNRKGHCSHEAFNSTSAKSSSDPGSRQNGKSNRRQRKQKSSYHVHDENRDQHDETVFHETFGSRSYTWTFRSSKGQQFRSSTNGFQWSKFFGWDDHGRRYTESDGEDDYYEDDHIGSSSDRRTLNLPLKGPLKLEDVKSAFRAAALKWHPDKHPGRSQEAASEKFKLCVSAYKSLCTALGTG